MSEADYTCDEGYEMFMSDNTWECSVCGNKVSIENDYCDECGNYVYSDNEFDYDI